MSGYNPFDRLTELIELTADNKINQIYSCLPCKVKTYDKAKQKVEVDILVKLNQPYQETEREFQSIAEVPVGFMNSDDGNAYMSFPVKAGDIGIVVFSTLDIDNYLSGNADVAVDTESYGRGQLKDAMFFPTFRPWNKALTGLSDDDIIIKNNDTTFTLKNDGTFQMSNNISGYELITVLDELLTKLISATTITMLGASPFTAATVADLTAIQVKLQTFKV